MAIQQPNELLKCPHCDEEMDSIADDFAIAGRTGTESESTEQCGFCDEWFSCERLPDGTIDVQEAEVER